jgi:hypothetical protein
MQGEFCRAAVEIVRSTDLEFHPNCGKASLEDLEALLETDAHHGVVTTETRESIEEPQRILEPHGEFLVGFLDLMNSKTTSVCAELRANLRER